MKVITVKQNSHIKIYFLEDDNGNKFTCQIDELGNIIGEMPFDEDTSEDIKMWEAIDDYEGSRYFH